MRSARSGIVSARRASRRATSVVREVLRMAEGRAPVRARAGGIERIVLLLGLLLIVGVCAWSARPVAALFPPHEQPLDVEGAQPDGGIAYRVPLRLPAEIESDKDGGLSALEVLEDGIPLEPHALHQALRDGSAGRFSHWGATLYLSASDGGDPRTGRHAYVLRWPAALPAWTDDALRLASGGGVALLLLALLLAWTRRRTFAAGVPALAALGVCALLVLRSSWWAEFGLLESARDLGHAVVSDPVAKAAALPRGPSDEAPAVRTTPRFGNVTRLLPGGTPARFEAHGDLPAGDDSRSVRWQPAAGVALDGDFVRLDPGGPALVARLDPPLPLEDVAELLLPARVRAGGDLELRLLSPEAPEAKPVQVALPVVEGEGVQVLRVPQPLQLYVGRDAVTVAAIELESPAQAARGAQLAVDELIVRGPSARFLRATHGEHPLVRDDEQRPGAWQSVPGRFVLPLDGPGRLVKGAVALFGRAPAQPLRVVLRYVDAHGDERVVLDDLLTGLGPWRELRSELPRDAAASGDALVLEVPSLPPGTAVGWSGVRLVDTSRAPRRVLVALLDTLRADALSSFGGSEASTPVLDALGERGVRFTRCYAQAHWTRPSVPSIMTSRYVAATGVDTVGQQLPTSYTTLAEAFAGAGFLTLADVSNTNAGPSSGLDQGWDRMRLYGAPGDGSSREQLLAGELPELLARSLEEDLLLYVHLMDAHSPYGPFAAPQHDDAPDGVAVPRNVRLDREWVERPTLEGRRYWYHRDVEAMDAALGEFLDLLGATWGAAGRDALNYAILADHGEYLGEHDQWGHGWYRLMPEIVHVPFVLGGPALPSGVTVDAPVENIDAAPTLLALLGLPSDAMPGVDGRSLLPLVRDGDAAGPRVAVAGVRLGKSEQFALYGRSAALLGDQQKLVQRLALDHAVPRDDGPLTYASLDVGTSAEESLLTRTLRDSLAARFGALWNAYDEAGEQRRVALWGEVAPQPAMVDAEALRQLEALGYLER